MRQSGILLHISSLPSDEGIGTLGPEARKFADFMSDAGISVWQVLPIGPTGYGESPYQSTSTFAGNPLFISITDLVKRGIFSGKGLPESPLSVDPSKVDYEKIRPYKDACLRVCFKECGEALKEKTDLFCKTNSWVRDFALFTAVKKHFGEIMWTKWPDREIRFRKKNALNKYSKMLKDEIDFCIFEQYLFDLQWNELKSYCNGKGIRIFGDIPIYVAEDSADTWTHPEIFQLDKNRIPTRVAGVPPDLFTADGQLWGNPLYRWRFLRLNGYQWWVMRLKALAVRYDMIRIDHFIGFANYYSIPYGAPNARNGKWVVGPGYSLFRVLKKKIPDLSIVAEDLGCVNDRVRKLLRQCGYPGMKVLSFGFGGDHEENPHFPSHYTENSVVYTGTHDNDTVIGWCNTADPESLEDAKNVLGFDSIGDAPDAFIRKIFASECKLAVVPMQDLLNLDGKARMNYPGSIGGNWQWRLVPGEISTRLAERLDSLNSEYNRKG